jgi:hypothetical protein
LRGELLAAPVAINWHMKQSTAHVGSKKSIKNGSVANSEKPISCGQFAEILLKADAILTPEDRRRIAAGIEEARRRMNHEHLH